LLLTHAVNYNIFYIMTKNKISLYIGFSFVLLISVLILFIGSRRASYLDQFYTLYFEVDFLEGIKPGILIKYHSGVTVGEVVSVRLVNNKYILDAKVSKDLFLYKDSTRVFAKSFGLFGKTYIDISTSSHSFSQELYNSNDTILIDKVVSMQETLNSISEYMHKAENNKYSPLEENLLNIKGMISMINKDLHQNSRLVLSLINSNRLRFVDNTSLFARNLAFRILQYTNKPVQLITDFDIQRISIIGFVQSIKENANYKMKNMSYWHDDHIYDFSNYYLISINKKLTEYIKTPYKIIYK